MSLENRSQRTVLRRIGELEDKLEAARRRAERAEFELARIKSGIWWRVLSRLRRAFSPTGGAAREDRASVPVGRESDRWTGLAADFIARLPAEALVDAEVAGAHALRRIDFAAVMPDLADGFSGSTVGAPGSPAASDAPSPLQNAWRIAFVGSEELHRELAFDAAITRIDRSSWKDQLGVGRFDFLLIEGCTLHPSNGWAHAFSGDEQAGDELRALIHEASRQGLRSACWMRQAGTGQRAGDWIKPLVDIAFEADGERVGQEGIQRAEWLAPAIQPRLYNPVTVPPLLKAARFARQCALFDDLEACLTAKGVPQALGPLLDRVILVDSRWAVNEAALESSPRLVPSSLGSITPCDRAALLRLVGAEIMPILSSDPVRALQAKACGALVIDLATLGQGAGEVSDPAAFPLGDALARARAAHLETRRVLTEHCFANRLEHMAGALGLPARLASPPPAIACLLVSRRPHLIHACLERFRADLYPYKELVVVVHRDDADLSAIRALVRPGEPVRVLQMGEHWSLGTCLNLAFSQTDAPYWAKWDDDDFYGPHYLSDFMLYRRAVDFDIAGKPRAFSWFEKTAELHWDERWGARANVLRTPADTRNTGIAGATLVGHRRVLEATPFPDALKRGTDSEFLRRAIDHGWTILSTDPFNFVRFRSADPDFHTWKIQEPEAKAHSRRVGGDESIAAIAFA